MMSPESLFTMGRRYSVFECKKIYASCLRRFYSNKNKSYSHTVQLPKTPYPVHLSPQSRVELDESISRRANFDHSYEYQLNRNFAELETDPNRIVPVCEPRNRNFPEKPVFVLLDGPPYANGDVHAGHAINKILKDVIVRYKAMDGHRVTFRPGWDCHGLPIELKCARATVVVDDHLSPLDMRRACRDFANETILKHMKIFKRWAVLADWKNPYTTMDKNYEAKQLEIFWKFYQSGLIYRALMPVYWSPSSGSALAEAELEYNRHHKSQSVFFRFHVHNFPLHRFVNNCSKSAKIFALVWTTTPWTLPLNDAISYDPGETYCLLVKKCSRKSNFESEYFLVGKKSLENSCTFLLTSDHELIGQFAGGALEGVVYMNRMKPENPQPFLPSTNVSADVGTGLLHNTFAHGHEDFDLAKSNQKQIECFVDEQGCYTPGLHPALTTKDVLGEELMSSIMQILGDDVINVSAYIHSYPYDWRTKKPVIIRASQQWFFDVNKIRPLALEALQKVPIIGRDSWLPMENMIEKRRHWCISRQRCWGVPIPVFYAENDSENPSFSPRDEKRVLVNEKSIEHAVSLVKEHGTDCWWTMDDRQLMPDKVRQSLNCAPDLKITKSRDIFDIWFDSGIAWSTLNGWQPADVVLEGYDQFRGWFQSLLLTSAGYHNDLRRSAPYKTVYVHGFAVDERGEKMSKSIGNVIDPSHVTDCGLGVDGLRFWSVFYGADNAKVMVGPKVLAECQSRLKTLRVFLRFTLGNLTDFEPNRDRVPREQMRTADRMVLHLLAGLADEVLAAYENYRLNVALSKLYDFSQEVSSLYFAHIKDRLYCETAHGPARHSAQTALWCLGDSLCRLLAPVLPHMAEEYFDYAPGRKIGDAFKLGLPRDLDQWKDPDLYDMLNRHVLPLRRSFLAENGAKDLNRFVLKIIAPKATYEILKIFHKNQKSCTNSDLTEFFRIAKLDLICGPENLENCQLDLKLSSHTCCARCRKFLCENNANLCTRCDKLVNDFEPKLEARV